MAGGSGEEENYWPGYVDALTTMTMVLTFIMMILGVVIFAMSQNVSKAIIESIANAAEVEVPSAGNVQDFRDKVIEAVKKSREPQPPPPDPVQEQAAGPTPAQGSPSTSTLAAEKRIETSALLKAEPPPKGAALTNAGSVLTIAFRRRGIELDERSRAELKAAVESSAELRSAAEVEIKAYADTSAMAISEARRLAYYRAMLMRNALVEAGVPAATIVVRLEDGSSSDADLVRIFTR